ncbi:hypothetical protein A5741_05425 [Mycolicibacterium conceptionense]|uniref:helix-turn-helix domain-containing protein n=1 Tax=Mycolicibacterium conceptionense TaxID=451644 RepID=UPI00096E9F55|nr:helix-turn-helix domain-containing protein [Mycolicibacterium conceptionense]OMB73160.1 hypothetical protein A5741_05425 [Mycolicibacterium conceptionense]
MVPSPWQSGGPITLASDTAQLRIAHPDASNTDLAERCMPPMTKHTFAGRLRRLISAAEQRALDIPA